MATLLGQAHRQVFLGPLVATAVAWAGIVGIRHRFDRRRVGPAPGRPGDSLEGGHPDARLRRTVAVAGTPWAAGSVVSVLVRRDGVPVRLQCSVDGRSIVAYEAGTGNVLDQHTSADGIERTPNRTLRIGVSTYEIDPELASRAEIDAFIAFAAGHPPRPPDGARPSS